MNDGRTGVYSIYIYGIKTTHVHIHTPPFCCPPYTHRVHYLCLRAVGEGDHLGRSRLARVDLYDGHGAVGVVDGLYHGVVGEGDAGRHMLCLTLVSLVKLWQQVVSAVVPIAVEHYGA